MKAGADPAQKNGRSLVVLCPFFVTELYDSRHHVFF